MTDRRRQSILRELDRGRTPVQILDTVTRIIQRKRSWRPAEKAMTLAAWKRDIDDVMRTHTPPSEEQPSTKQETKIL